MSTDQSFDQFSRDFESIIESVKNKLNSLYRYHNDPYAKSQLMAEAEDDIQEAANILGSIELDIRHYDYRLRSKALAQVKKYRHQLEEQRQAIDVERLEGRSRDAKEQARQNKESRRMLLGNQHTLDQTDIALDNTLRNLHDANAIGADAHGKLVGQTGQLTNTRDTLANMDEDLGYANRVIRRIRRRMATSKLLNAFIILLELAIIGCIIYFRYYAPRGSDNN